MQISLRYFYILFLVSVFLPLNIYYSQQNSTSDMENFVFIPYEWDRSSISLTIPKNTKIEKIQNTYRNRNQETLIVHVSDYKKLLSWSKYNNLSLIIYTDIRKGRTTALIYKSKVEMIPIYGVYSFNESVPLSVSLISEL